MRQDIEKIKWLFANTTSYQISKHCGISTQSVDRYKLGQYDLLNMKLKTALELVHFAESLAAKKGVSLDELDLAAESSTHP